MVNCLCVCVSFSCTVHVFQCAFLLSVQVISGDDDLSFYQKYCNMFEFMMQVHDPHTVVLVSCSQMAPLSLCKAGRHIRLCVSVIEREVVWLHETAAVCTL